MKQLLEKLLAMIFFLRERLILSIAYDYIGTDFTPKDEVKDELACAQAVTTILKRAGTLDNVITGTWTLYDHLSRNRAWVPLNGPQEGCVAVAPTGTGYRGTIGHTWIVGKNGVWMSNDSWTGKWTMNYTKEKAEEKYTKEKGIKIHYYKYIGKI